LAAQVRLHLLTARGFCQERVELDVGQGLRLDKLLLRLDESGVVEKGFFKSVLKGKQGVTLLRNGERTDLSELRSIVIVDQDRLAILSPISGG